MEELNQNGDSTQEAQDNKPELLNQELVEKLKSAILSDKKFKSDFYSNVGDSVKTILENQIMKVVEPAQYDSQSNHTKIEQSTPAMVGSDGLEKEKAPVENNEVAMLQKEVAQLRNANLDTAIRNYPLIQRISSLNNLDAERFVQRAKNIALNNNIQPNQINLVFSENSEIVRDVQNQIFVLSNRTDINIPNNKPVTEAPTPKQLSPKEQRMMDMFLGKR